MNPLEMIDKQYVAEGEKHVATRGRVRASGIGHQPRRQAMKYWPEQFPARQNEPRSERFFEVGNQRHDALRAKLAASGFKGRIPVRKEDEQEFELPLVSGWKIVGHPDGVLDEATVRGVTMTRVLLEVKTAGSKGWRDVTRGIVDETYLDQADLYCHGLGLNGTYFLYERKDTQQLHELLIPHDKGRAFRAMERAKEVALAIDAGFSPLDMAPCQGEQYGWRQSSKTGKTLGWGCSYCQFTEHCFPTHVRVFIGGKVACVDQTEVRLDAKVISFGAEVVPRGTWVMMKGAEEDDA